MNPLSLSPLPTHRDDDPSSMRLMEREGFVDEAVVTALVRASHLGRSVADPTDLALAADDLDFAGWRLSRSVTVRSAEVPPQVIDAIVRRSMPSTTGKAKHSSQPSRRARWWVAGLAGVLILPVVLPSLFPQLAGMNFGSLFSPERMTSSELVPVGNDEPVKGSSGADRAFTP